MPRLPSFHLRLSSDHQISNGSLVSAHCVLIFWPQWPFILIWTTRSKQPASRKTRTCIHTPGYPPLIPSDLSPSRLTSAPDEARILYLDGRVHETAFLVAQKAACKNVPVLIDAECIREGLDDLLNLADYAIHSAKFSRAWTGAVSVPSALVSMLLRLPKIKVPIVTLGEDGCIMLERSVGEDSQTEEMGADNLLESLKRRKDDSVTIPTCISSVSLVECNSGELKPKK